MRTTWIMPLAALAVAAALLAAPTLTAQDPDPPADPVAAVTLAAEELAAAEAEVRGLDRTIDRRQGEADALDPRPEDCADRTARRLCRRHDWYADVLTDLAARKAAAAARVATARAAAEELAAPTLGARVEALESEVDGLADELHAVEDELGLEIARVEAAIPAPATTAITWTAADLETLADALRLIPAWPPDGPGSGTPPGTTCISWIGLYDGERPAPSTWPAECAADLETYRLAAVAVNGWDWPDDR